MIPMQILPATNPVELREQMLQAGAAPELVHEVLTAIEEGHDFADAAQSIAVGLNAGLALSRQVAHGEFDPPRVACMLIEAEIEAETAAERVRRLREGGG
jgi:hypothetical protein